MYFVEMVKWRGNDCSHCCMIHLSLFGYNLSSSMIIWSMSTFVGSSEYKDEWEKKISFTFSLRSLAKTSLRCKEISGLFTRVYASSHFHLAFRLLRSNISCFSSTIKDTEYFYLQTLSSFMLKKKGEKKITLDKQSRS